MNPPKAYRTVHINERMLANQTLAFSLNHCKLKLLSMSPIITDCTGYFCDRQNCEEVMKNGKVCGCFKMGGRLSSVTLMCDLNIEYVDKVGKFFFLINLFIFNVIF